MTDKETLNDIFRTIQIGGRERVFCIFNRLHRTCKPDDLWCSNSCVMLDGDLNGLVYICDTCLYKKFDYEVKMVK